MVAGTEGGRMAGRAKGHELIPSARRLITSLRDMGYDFQAAVADVVDNSIEARATKIDIDVHFDGDESWVRIADNGTGMKPAQMREALRYGAERDYDEEALGKFGLGLKTASMSQCQRLTVASRSSGERADVRAYCWDLEHVAKENTWEILEVGRDARPADLDRPLRSHTGTVVLWQRLDRILGYKHPYGEVAKRRLSAMCRELEQHLAMVFHRYLAGDAGRRGIRIHINGNAVQPWDPFVRHEAKTKQLERVVLHYDHEGIRGDILIDPYVLPHQDDFGSMQEHAAAAGPLKWNRQQGFYIYRANRMIQSGGWSNLRTLDEHTKLARVAVSFDPRLDEAFRINVAKMRVQLPALLREHFEKAVGPVIKIAQSAYRRSATSSGRGNNATVSKATHAASSATQTSIGPRPDARGTDTEGGRPAGQLWSLAEVRRAAERVAKGNERPVIRSVFDRLAKEEGT